MKTKFLNLLRWRLHNQNGVKRCDICKDNLRELIDSIKNDETIHIRLTPDLNASGICTGYHIEKLEQIHNP